MRKSKRITIKPKIVKLMRKSKRAKIEHKRAKLMRNAKGAKIGPKGAQIGFCNVGGTQVMVEPKSMDVIGSARTRSLLRRRSMCEDDALILYEAKVVRC